MLNVILEASKTICGLLIHLFYFYTDLESIYYFSRIDFGFICGQRTLPGELSVFCQSYARIKDIADNIWDSNPALFESINMPGVELRFIV